MRRKGELSPSRVDREWPHQIMLPADECLGQQYNVIAEFCADLSLCPRGHSLGVSDKWQRVFCFAEKGDAEKSPSPVRRNVVRSSGARPVLAAG